MFNIGSGELALIAVVALLILGPKRLPELARGIGKFMREFRRQTDEVRGVVEREFYKMDQEASIHEAPPQLHADSTPVVRPAQDAVALGSGVDDPHANDPHHGHPDLQAATDAVASQLTKGAAQGEPIPVAPPAEPAAPVASTVTAAADASTDPQSKS
ncbi:MAG: twin-arginine translocase TatA/TatE family subunit [Myxococcaceae bacterium]